MENKNEVLFGGRDAEYSAKINGMEAEFGLRPAAGIGRSDGDYISANTGVDVKKSLGLRQYIAEKTAISSSELFDFAKKFADQVESLAELGSENRMLMAGINKEEAYLFYDKVTRQIFDVDIDEVPNMAAFNYILYRMRLSFMRTYAVFLNCVLTPARYADFKGKPEITIRSWMNAGKVDVVTICGKRFVMVPESEMMDYNFFMMDRYLQKEPKNITEQKQRAKELYHYRRVYKDISRDRAVDSVKGFMDDCKYFADDEDMERYRVKRYTNSAYDEYRRWCIGMKLTPVTDRMFSGSISRLGYRRFNTRKRGFYVWIDNSYAEREKEEARKDAEEVLGKKEVFLADLFEPEEDDSWLPDFSKGSEV